MITIVATGLLNIQPVAIITIGSYDVTFEIYQKYLSNSNYVFVLNRRDDDRCSRKDSFIRDKSNGYFPNKRHGIFYYFIYCLIISYVDSLQTIFTKISEESHQERHLPTAPTKHRYQKQSYKYMLQGMIRGSYT